MMKPKRKVAVAVDNREELFTRVIRDLWRADNLKAVAKEAGVSVRTIYQWTNGVVYAPRINTLFPVARALGYQISITPPKAKRGRPSKLRRVK